MKSLQFDLKLQSVQPHKIKYWLNSTKYETNVIKQYSLEMNELLPDQYNSYHILKLCS